MIKHIIWIFFVVFKISVLNATNFYSSSYLENKLQEQIRSLYLDLQHLGADQDILDLNYFLKFYYDKIDFQIVDLDISVSIESQTYTAVNQTIFLDSYQRNSDNDFILNHQVLRPFSSNAFCKISIHTEMILNANLKALLLHEIFGCYSSLLLKNRRSH